MAIYAPIARFLSFHRIHTMAAKTIDGTVLAKYAELSLSNETASSNLSRSIRQGVADRIKTLQATYPRFQPRLAVVQVGERPDSSTYIRMKGKASEEVGINFQHVKIPAASEVDEIIRVVENLNIDDRVSGILVQLPLGDHIKADGERRVTEAISPKKDVDGQVSLGYLLFLMLM